MTAEKRYKRKGYVVEWKKGGRWQWHWEHAHNLASQAIYLYEVYVTTLDFKTDKKRGDARLEALYVEVQDV